MDAKITLAYAAMGTIVGRSIIAAGLLSALSGIMGHSSWCRCCLGLSNGVNDLVPALVLLVVGISVLWRTRSKSDAAGDGR
jgi:hypothetical protein